MRTAGLILLVAAVCGSTAAADKPEPKYKQKPLAYWMAKFEAAETDKDRDEPADAIKAFGVDGAPAVPKLVAMLDDRSPGFRRDIAEMLCAIGPGAKGAVPDLVRMVKERKGHNRVEALRVLEAIGPAAKEAVPTIVAVLDDRDVYIWALRAVYAIRPPAEDVIPSLTKVIRGNRVEEKDSGFGFAVEDLVKTFGAAAAPALIEMIDDEQERTRYSIAEALGGFGPVAKAAGPKLRTLLDAENPRTQFEAARALWRIEKDKAVIPTLVALLVEPAPPAGVTYAYPADYVWWGTEASARVLAEIGPGAAAALPSLEAVLKSPAGKRLKVREAVEAAIKKIKAAPAEKK